MSRAGVCVALIKGLLEISWAALRPRRFMQRRFASTPAAGRSDVCVLWLLVRIRRERLTGHARMPVHKRAIRIVFPCPHVQGVERRKPEAVGRLEIVEYLSHQLRRGARVRLVPLLSQHQEIGSRKLHLAVSSRF